MAQSQPGENTADNVTMDVAEQENDTVLASQDDTTEERQSDGKKVKQLTLRLPEEYHRKLKILAACSGKSMTEILVGCIDERLEHCLERELKNVK